MADKSEAKKKMLGNLSKEMRDMMGENYGEGLKDKMTKVTVAGDSPEAVEKGLNKAEEILKKKVGHMEMMGEESEEESEDYDDEEGDAPGEQEEPGELDGDMEEHSHGMEQMEGESMEEYHQRMMERIKELEAMLGEPQE